MKHKQGDIFYVTRLPIQDTPRKVKQPYLDEIVEKIKESIF